MSKIWIVNSSGHDFSKAKKYGSEMVSLTEGRVNIFNTERILKEFEGKMQGYKEGDWLLLSGNSVLNVLASLVVKERFDTMNLLIYNVVEKEYIPREIKI